MTVGEAQDATHEEVRDAIDASSSVTGPSQRRSWLMRSRPLGERTARRYLSKMVDDGELRVIAGGRSTRYVAGGNAMTPWCRSSLKGSVVGKDV